MRIVSGSARGRRLHPPKGDAIRPTSDRVREAVFNMLESRGAVEGARVVDLFAGTGALGIEALSRGAASAVFVENAGVARRLIQANLDLTGLGAGATVVHDDALRFVAGGGAAGASLVFADPPYSFERWDELFTALGATGGRPGGAGPAGDADGPLVVAEADRELSVPGGWEVVASRRHGGTVVTLARRKGR